MPFSWCLQFGSTLARMKHLAAERSLSFPYGALLSAQQLRAALPGQIHMSPHEALGLLLFTISRSCIVFAGQGNVQGVLDTWKF